MKLALSKYYVFENGIKVEKIDCVWKAFIFATIINKKDIFHVKSKYIKEEVDDRGNTIYNRFKSIEDAIELCNNKFN